jgi:elongation factor 1-beta
VPHLPHLPQLQHSPPAAGFQRRRPKESRGDMLARIKKEVKVRTAKKEAKQRTLVAIEIKPWDVEQDLMVLWKKITTSINQEGLQWAQACNLVDVAYGIQKIQTTFVMGATNSSDDVIEAILEMKTKYRVAKSLP